jgi:hypothetical protein
VSKNVVDSWLDGRFFEKASFGILSLRVRESILLRVCMLNIKQS